jgi:Fur family ferric uptake transcriptional regulator
MSGKRNTGNSDEAIEKARVMVRASGDRVTAARVNALAVLLAERRALSHTEIEHALSRGGTVDRVTLYRVLEWLVEKGLAHRIAGADRVWRYSIASAEHGDHAHFQCNQCGKVLCLEQLAKPEVRLPRLPSGYRTERVEMTVQGRCAECV